METSGQKTVSIWVKPANINTNKVPISKYRSDTNEDGWAVIFNPSGYISCLIKNDASSGFSSASTAYNANQWYLVVFTWDTNSGTVKFYVNGAFIGQSATITGVFSGNIRPVLIGRGITSSDGIGSPFNGVIDDVRMYNAIMPTSQIKEQYHTGLNNLLANGKITKEEYIERLIAIK